MTTFVCFMHEAQQPNYANIINHLILIYQEYHDRHLKNPFMAVLKFLIQGHSVLANLLFYN